MRTQFIEQKNQINILLEIEFRTISVATFWSTNLHNFSLSVYKSTNLQQIKEKTLDSIINIGPNLQFYIYLPPPPPPPPPHPKKTKLKVRDLVES